ncbi:MAG: Lipolytic enzyme precursor [Frankiales bacterium]|jgi:acyl-CoA thioesterase-1|nr:Lipolytic enzyme precursor [Frankiales bacterium]
MGIVRRLFRRSFEQVDAYRDAWTTQNAAALAAEGPLWVVLGDSAAQGVGASSHLSGYVGVVLSGLGPQWRVVNLSRSGARTREVVDVQWPAAAGLQPALVTALVGGNDALHTSRTQWLADVRDLCAALPAGAVVGTVARGLFERKTRRVNEVIRSSATEHGLLVADLWAHTGPPYRGLYADGLHPNDRGYAQWVSALEAALQQGGHLPE